MSTEREPPSRGLRRTRSSDGMDSSTRLGRSGTKVDPRLTKSLTSSDKHESDYEDDLRRGHDDLDRASPKHRSQRRASSAEDGVYERSDNVPARSHRRASSAEDGIHERNDTVSSPAVTARKAPSRRGTVRSKSAESFDFAQKLKGRGAKKPPKESDCASPSKESALSPSKALINDKVVPKLAPPPQKAPATALRPCTEKKDTPEWEEVPANDDLRRLSQSVHCGAGDTTKANDELGRTIHKTRKSRVKKSTSSEGSSMFDMPDQPKANDDNLDMDDVFDSFFQPGETMFSKPTNESSPKSVAKELRDGTSPYHAPESDSVVAALVTTVRRPKPTSGRSRMPPKRTSSMSASHGDTRTRVASQ